MHDRRIQQKEDCESDPFHLQCFRSLLVLFGGNRVSHNELILRYRQLVKLVFKETDCAA